MSTDLRRIGEKARSDQRLVFTSLYHHVTDVDHLRAWRQRPDDLPITVKAALVATEVMRRRWGWRYYAKAMNQVRRVRRWSTRLAT